MLMKFSPIFQSICLLASIVLASAQDKTGFQLKDGDRVLFYGDSITDQRLYTTFAETYVITRFPDLKIEFVHSGWGGDRVTGGGGGEIDLRLRRDVFAYKPTVMTIMLGMNDGSYRAFDQPIFDRYAKGYQHIIDEVKKGLPGIRLTLIQPSPFDDVSLPPRFEGGYNSVLVRYSQFVKQAAEREHAGVADLNTPIVAVLEKAKATDAELAKKIIPDRVHPGPSGHLLMAAALLKSWNAPATVTAVEIDAAGTRIVRSENTKITDRQAANGLSWTQTDRALPLSVEMSDAVMALAVNSSDFVQTLNQQLLKVTGLSAARHALKIDGAMIGVFTKEQLTEGINLAMLNTPMVQQSAEVHRLTLQHNNTHFTRWRQVQVPLANNKSPKVQKAVAELMSALDDDEGEVIKQQRAAAQPRARKYELIPE